MPVKLLNEDDRKRPISFSLSTNDKKLIQEARKILGLKTDGETIMMGINRILQPARQKIALPTKEDAE